MRFLVTGGAGFIGSHLVDTLIQEGHNVTVLDNLVTGNKENINPHMKNKSFKFLLGDIKNQTILSKAMKNVDVVVHLAANLQGGGGVGDPLADFETNVRGTFNILSVATRFHVDRVVFSSSVLVYGGREKISELPMSEEDTVKIITPYGASKFTGENYCLLFNKIYGLKTVVLRYFNVYGPRVRHGNPYMGVVNKFVQDCFKGAPMRIYGGGDQTRDFVDVRDVISATTLAIEKDSAIGEVINVGSGVATNINTLAKLIHSIFSKMGRVELPDPVHGFPPKTEASRHGYKHAQADLKKAERVLGYRPKISIVRGLEDLIRL